MSKNNCHSNKVTHIVTCFVWRCKGTTFILIIKIFIVNFCLTFKIYQNFVRMTELASAPSCSQSKHTTYCATSVFCTSIENRTQILGLEDRCSIHWAMDAYFITETLLFLVYSCKGNTFFYLAPNFYSKFLLINNIFFISSANIANIIVFSITLTVTFNSIYTPFVAIIQFWEECISVFNLCLYPCEDNFICNIFF